MNRILIVAAIAVALIVALVYVFKPRPKGDLTSPEQIKSLPWKDAFDRSIACEEKREGEHCTLIMEVNALKAQHAKQGEGFWVNQMLRLGDWYTYVGTKDYKPGQPDAPEIAKAVELYDWMLENKPFFGDKVLYGYARLYDSPYNEQWAAAHASEAHKLYTRHQERFPSGAYASDVTAALNRLR